MWHLLHRGRSPRRRGNFLLGRSGRHRKLLPCRNTQGRSWLLIIHIIRMVFVVVIHWWLLMHPGVRPLLKHLASRKQQLIEYTMCGVIQHIVRQPHKGKTIGTRGVTKVNHQLRFRGELVRSCLWRNVDISPTAKYSKVLY